MTINFIDFLFCFVIHSYVILLLLIRWSSAFAPHENTDDLDSLHCKFRCSDWETRFMCRSTPYEAWSALQDHSIFEFKHSVYLVNVENNCTKPLKVSRSTFERFPMLESFTAIDAHITQISNIDLRSSLELKSLNLSSNDITEITPYIFGWALHLQTIDLTYNQIADIAESAFDKNNIQYDVQLDFSGSDEYDDLKSLIPPRPDVGLRHLDIRHLLLSHNKLTALKAVWFKTLRNLEIVTLDGNLLKSVNFNHVFQFNINLRVLHAGHNGLEEIVDFSPENFWSLEDVNLAHNPLVRPWTARINFGVINVSSMNADRCRIGWKTRHFDGSWNNITEVTIDRMDGDGHMQVAILAHLNLAHNYINSLVNFTDLPELVRLDLSYNQLHTIEATTFAGLRSLTRLRLDHNNLHRIEYSALHDMHDLTTLHLAHNRLRKFHLQSLMHNLIVVDVFGNNLTSIDLDLRRKAPNLRTIYAGENDWDCGILTTAILVLNTDDIRLLPSDNVQLINRGDYNSTVKGIGCHSGTKPTVIDGPNVKPGITLQLQEKLEILMDAKIHEFETRILDVISNITNQNMMALTAQLAELSAIINNTRSTA